MYVFCTMFTRSYIHTCLHTYIHTNIHTCVNFQLRWWLKWPLRSLLYVMYTSLCIVVYVIPNYNPYINYISFWWGSGSEYIPYPLGWGNPMANGENDFPIKHRLSCNNWIWPRLKQNRLLRYCSLMPYRGSQTCTSVESRGATAYVTTPNVGQKGQSSSVC